MQRVQNFPHWYLKKLNIFLFLKFKQLLLLCLVNVKVNLVERSSNLSHVVRLRMKSQKGSEIWRVWEKVCGGMLKMGGYNLIIWLFGWIQVIKMLGWPLICSKPLVLVTTNPTSLLCFSFLLLFYASINVKYWFK